MLAPIIPLGIIKPILDVQKSWISHSNEQLKAVGELILELSTLQVQALGRISGFDNNEDLARWWARR